MAFRPRIGLATATLATALALASAAPAAASDCSYPTTYPGDNAPKEQIAAWMAGGAVQAGLPGELPVMAGLVESDLHNLPQGDSTTAGYFQMRVDVWNSGDYQGFPDHPTLQLQWFIDQAQNVRKQHYANSDTTFGSSDSQYGEWVADVERPPQQNRGLYQPRLADARSLIAAGCSEANGGSQPPDQPAGGSPSDGSASAPDAQLIPDSVLPALRMHAQRYQGASRTGSLVATASCANESCLVRAAAAVAVPGHGVFRMLVLPRQVARGATTAFDLTLTKRQRGLVSAAARSGNCALGVIRVIAANDGGWRLSASRTVFLGPRRLCAP